MMQTDPARARRLPARFFESGGWDTVTCRLCAHLCSIAPSRSGACGVRSNKSGVLYADNYGKVAVARAASPGELPFYHFHPASRLLLVGMKGCDMRCPFCNTYTVSQTGGARTEPCSPDDLVQRALDSGLQGLAFGINEPAVSHEYVIDCLRAARAKGLMTVLQTSGQWASDAFHEAIGTADAIVFGFKGFDTRALATDCGGHLEVIRLNLETAVLRGVHVEASYLVLDNRETWRQEADTFAAWLSEVDVRVPAAVTLLEPAFSWKGPGTSMDHAREAHMILGSHLRHVYLHHPDAGLMDTRCSGCGKVLVRRGIAGTIVTPAPDGKCPGCGEPHPCKL